MSNRPGSKEAVAGKKMRERQEDANAGRERAFDAQAVMSHVDGDLELLREIVELFSEDSPILFERISAAIEERHAERLWSSAHALKGAVGNFAAAPAFELARRLEGLGREADFSAAEEVRDRLAEELERLRGDLRSFVEKG